MRRIKTNLKAILKTKGMTQKELAQRAKVREATITALCKDEIKRYPRDVLERIANVLEIDDINEIITLVNEKDPQAE